MDQLQQHQHDERERNDGSGFLLGIVIGSLATLLFTTERGKEILKDITNKSIGSWEDVEKRLQELEDSDEEAPTEYVTPEEKKEIRYLAEKEAAIISTEPSDNPAEKSIVATSNHKSTEEKTITGRRWFRGMKKRA